MAHSKRNIASTRILFILDTSYRHTLYEIGIGSRKTAWGALARAFTRHHRPKFWLMKALQPLFGSGSVAENSSAFSGLTTHVTLHCFLVFTLEIGVGRMFRSILQPFGVQISAPSSIVAALAGAWDIKSNGKTARRKIFLIIDLTCWRFIF